MFHEQNGLTSCSVLAGRQELVMGLAGQETASGAAGELWLLQFDWLLLLLVVVVVLLLPLLLPATCDLSLQPGQVLANCVILMPCVH